MESGIRGATRSRTWSRRPHGMDDEQTSLENQFLECSSGHELRPKDSSSAYHDVLIHFQALTEASWAPAFNDILHETLRNYDNSYTKCLRLSCEVMACLRDGGGSSITRMIGKLQARHMLVAGQDLCTDPAARHLLFSVIGWISLLYNPSRYQSRNQGSNDFKIALQSSNTPLKSKISIDKAARPLDELLRSFGALLPTLTQAGTQHKRSNYLLDTKFQVSYLNVAVMKTLANMEIIWVDSISAHLEFDPTTPSLSIFKCPSFCRLQSSDDAILSIILARFYEEEEKPSENFTISKMMTEVLLSYHLLFKDDYRARKYYRTRERARASLTPIGSYPAKVDHWLDVHCGNIDFAQSSASDKVVRDLYDINADFPIFKHRLQRVQDYMEGIAPNRFSSLWRDRRDLRLWYTIWAVIILGVMGVLLQALGIALAAMQVNLAFKALATPCIS